MAKQLFDVDITNFFDDPTNYTVATNLANRYLDEAEQSQVTSLTQEYQATQQEAITLLGKLDQEMNILEQMWGDSLTPEFYEKQRQELKVDHDEALKELAKKQSDIRFNILKVKEGALKQVAEQATIRHGLDHITEQDQRYVETLFNSNAHDKKLEEAIQITNFNPAVEDMVRSFLYNRAREASPDERISPQVFKQDHPAVRASEHILSGHVRYDDRVDIGKPLPIIIESRSYIP